MTHSGSYYKLVILLFIIGASVASGGLLTLLDPERLIGARSDSNSIVRMAASMLSGLPAGARRMVARIFGLGFLGAGGALLYFAWVLVSGDSPERAPRPINRPAVRKELAKPGETAKFSAFCAQVAEAANRIATNQLKAELQDETRIYILNPAGKIMIEVDEESFYLKYYKTGSSAEKTGQAIMHIAAMEAIEDDEQKARGVEVARRTPPPHPTPVPPSPTPDNSTPTPTPEPTVDPKIAEVDRLMLKAGQQWEAGKKDVSLMLAEEALKDAEANLPAGHPKIDEVRAKVKAARDGAKK